MKEDSNTVDFGHARVKHDEKSGLVREVFSEVSETYDLFNDVASLGFSQNMEKIRNLVIKSEKWGNLVRCCKRFW